MAPHAVIGWRCSWPTSTVQSAAEVGRLWPGCSTRFFFTLDHAGSNSLLQFEHFATGRKHKTRKIYPSQKQRNPAVYAGKQKFASFQASRGKFSCFFLCCALLLSSCVMFKLSQCFLFGRISVVLQSAYATGEEQQSEGDNVLNRR